MGSVVQLRSDLRCQKCSRVYHSACDKYLTEKCGHHTCCYCFSDTDKFCTICGVASTRIKITSPIGALEDLDVYARLLDLTLQKENELKRELVVLKEETGGLVEGLNRCNECRNKKSEKKLYLCATCHNLKFKDQEDVKKHGICSDCVIKNHMRKRHETVDFFPYLSAHQFSTHSIDIVSKSEELKESRDLLNESIAQFDVLSERATENIDVLTDMARRSKSTKYQIEAMERMMLFIDESKEINTLIHSEVKKSSTVFQENLTKLNEWYAIRTDSCMKDSEVIKLNEK